VGLKRDPLSLVSTIEELLGRKSSGSGQENREYGSRDLHAVYMAPSIRSIARSVQFASVLRARSLV
jgi:hypothetical protein